MPLSQAQLQSLGFQQTGTNIHLVNDSILSYVDGNENGNIGQPGVYLFVLHIREDHRSVIYVGKAKRGLETRIAQHRAGNARWQTTHPNEQHELAASLKEKNLNFAEVW